MCAHIRVLNLTLCNVVAAPLTAASAFSQQKQQNEQQTQQQNSSPRTDRTKQESAPVVYNLGARVHAEFFGRGHWFPAKITTVHSNGTFDVLYDDGAVETQIAEKHIKLMDGT